MKPESGINVYESLVMDCKDILANIDMKTKMIQRNTLKGSTGSSGVESSEGETSLEQQLIVLKNRLMELNTNIVC